MCGGRRSAVSRAAIVSEGRPWSQQKKKSTAALREEALPSRHGNPNWSGPLPSKVRMIPGPDRGFLGDSPGPMTTGRFLPAVPILPSLRCSFPAAPPSRNAELAGFYFFIFSHTSGGGDETSADVRNARHFKSSVPGRHLPAAPINMAKVSPW